YFLAVAIDVVPLGGSLHSRPSRPRLFKHTGSLSVGELPFGVSCASIVGLRKQLRNAGRWRPRFPILGDFVKAPELAAVAERLELGQPKGPGNFAAHPNIELFFVHRRAPSNAGISGDSKESQHSGQKLTALPRAHSEIQG